METRGLHWRWGNRPCWPESVSQSRYINLASRFSSLVVWNLKSVTWRLGFPGGSVVKNLPANTGDSGDSGSVPGLGRSLGGGNGNPLQSSCLGNPMDRGAWWAPKELVTAERLNMHACMHIETELDECECVSWNFQESWQVHHHLEQP